MGDWRGQALPGTAPPRGLPYGHDVSDVQPTWGTRRVFQAGFWLKLGSVKAALSPPAWIVDCP